MECPHTITASFPSWSEIDFVRTSDFIEPQPSSSTPLRSLRFLLFKTHFATKSHRDH